MSTRWHRSWTRTEKKKLEHTKAKCKMFSDSSRAGESEQRARRNIFLLLSSWIRWIPTATARIYIYDILKILWYVRMYGAMCGAHNILTKNLFQLRQSPSSRQRNSMLRAKRSRESEYFTWIYLVYGSFRSINVVSTRRCHILYFNRRSGDSGLVNGLDVVCNLELFFSLFFFASHFLHILRNSVRNKKWKLVKTGN